MSERDDHEPIDRDEQHAGPDPATLRAELEVAREENRRLRDSYARAKRSTYRRTALGFLAIGIASLAGAALFPALGTVFVALAGTGAFAGLVTYYLTPERFVSGSVTGATFGALADVESGLVRELELQDEAVYVPTPTLPDANARLFVPQHVDYALPDAEALGDLFVTTEGDTRQGVALPPSGDRLFASFEQTVDGAFEAAPDQIGADLAAALTEQFELVDDADVEIGADERATVALDGPAFGDLSRTDHPAVSLLAVGFAAGLDRPVTVETRTDERASAVVSLSWEQDGGVATGNSMEQEPIPAGSAAETSSVATPSETRN
ncbi:hypothetical protein [Haloarcula salina]|uniref:DUF7982 domain-containing protein n=1 Tax=Haloarcula salina TaxID=1429914 RepID=A0AA41G2V5_9EURY|nr:hypothetical protein [Haloarcula salina]MBV0903291.1 hypothetical protein [Haloarcula salina]